jgi:SAM-dependent methyltransferase
VLRLETVGLLICPACGAGGLQTQVFGFGEEGSIASGVLHCRSCRQWFPVEEGILELLSGGLAYAEDRSRFWKAHEEGLRQLGLAPDAPHPAGQNDDAVARQQAHFDWYADNETQTYAAYEATPFWRGADAIAFGEWRGLVRPGGRLLDAGCAQGRSTFPWMDLDIDVVGFDISKPLIRQASERYRRTHPRARASFFVADATRFPLRSASFDYVLGYGVLHHFPDPALTCREIVRVLRPGGLFLGSENNQTVFRGLFDLLQRIHPIWHEEAGAHALISEKDMRSWLEPAGCSVSVRTSVFLPPHVANWFSDAAAEKLLRATDRIAGWFPFTRKQGGLILVRAEKSGRSPSPAG